MDEESESFSKSKSLASGCCLAFAYHYLFIYLFIYLFVYCQFQPGVAYKKASTFLKVLNLAIFDRFHEILYARKVSKPQNREIMISMPAYRISLDIVTKLG